MAGSAKKNITGKMTFNLGHVHVVGELPFYHCGNKIEILYQVVREQEDKNINILW